MKIEHNAEFLSTETAPQLSTCSAKSTFIERRNPMQYAVLIAYEIDKPYCESPSNHQCFFLNERKLFDREDLGPPKEHESYWVSHKDSWVFDLETQTELFGQMLRLVREHSIKHKVLYFRDSPVEYFSNGR